MIRNTTDRVGIMVRTDEFGVDHDEEVRDSRSVGPEKQKCTTHVGRNPLNVTDDGDVPFEEEDQNISWSLQLINFN